jgi:hypothetical protein
MNMMDVSGLLKLTVLGTNMKLNTKLIFPTITGVCALSYVYSWTQNIMFPAWVPLIWCVATLVHDVYDYLENK